jgi:hypothetical protein
MIKEQGFVDLDAILVPISGGGMTSGIALAAKALNPKIKSETREFVAANISINLFTFVYFCLLLFTFVYFCLLLFTFV